MSSLCDDLANIWAAGIGPQYLKALYREYTDSSFQVTLNASPSHSGPNMPCKFLCSALLYLCYALTEYASAKVWST